MNSGARVCAPLATAMFTCLADRPCFLGTIGQAHPDDGVISTHRGAATIHMDGQDTGFRAYRPRDWQDLGCGLATHWDSPVGGDTTVASLSTDLTQMGSAAAPGRRRSRGERPGRVARHSLESRTFAGPRLQGWLARCSRR